MNLIFLIIWKDICKYWEVSINHDANIKQKMIILKIKLFSKLLSFLYLPEFFYLQKNISKLHIPIFMKFIGKVVLKKNVWYVFIRFYYKEWN